MTDRQPVPGVNEDIAGKVRESWPLLEVEPLYAAPPAPEPHLRGDIYLVSALVERPGKMGHRAQVGRFGSKEEAIGSSLELWQTDAWSVVSYDCTRCDKLMGTCGHPVDDSP